jgi:hypothetical protein
VSGGQPGPSVYLVKGEPAESGVPHDHRQEHPDEIVVETRVCVVHVVDGLVGESDAHGEDDADHDQDQEAPDREIRTVCFDEYCDGDEYQRGQDEHLHVSREVPGVGHALHNKRLSRKY